MPDSTMGLYVCFSLFTFSIIYLVPPPPPPHQPTNNNKHCLKFLLGRLYYPEELETMIMHIF